jgi:hypothetical protein
MRHSIKKMDVEKVLYHGTIVLLKLIYLLFILTWLLISLIIIFPLMISMLILRTLYKVDYAKAKELTFKQLYGGVFESYKNLDFFKKIQSYTDKKWQQFENTGFIEVPISNYRIEKNNVGEMNPQKLFNYLLQGYETSQNILVLWDMMRILMGKNTKLVLYTYDSFLDIDNRRNRGRNSRRN